MKIVNLTDHDVIVKRDDGTSRRYASLGDIARANYAHIERTDELDDGTPIAAPRRVASIHIPGSGHVDAIIVSTRIAELLECACMFNIAIDTALQRDDGTANVRVFAPLVHLDNSATGDAFIGLAEYAPLRLTC